jgi:mRNA-degrading endonuclease toxin of MazEF toxin-antitoxin module
VSIEQGCIFWHDFGPRQNHLQEGVRPALVVQTDFLNRLDGYANVIIVPLTTKSKSSPTYVPIQPAKDNSLTAPSWAITNQIFTLDKNDLKNPLGRISKEELYAVKQALKIALGIPG